MRKAVIAAIGIVAALGAIGTVVVLKMRGGAPEAAESQPAEAAKAETGHLKLTPEQIKASGIKIEPLERGTLAPDIEAFGVIQEDPGASFIVRAEAPGTLALAEGKPWPDVGERIAAETVVGILEPRVMPSDQITLAAQRVTLQGQVTTAQADLNTANIALDAAKTTYERLKKLNDQDKNVSDRVVEEALAKVKTEEAHVAGAKKTVDISTGALDAVQSKLTPIPLKVTHAGEVVEVNAHPGEAIESGQPILRVATFDTVIAAVNVPIDENPAANVSEARIVPTGGDEKPLTGTRMGTAEMTDPKTRDRVMMFRIQVGKDKNLRPGRPVVAYMPAEGDPLKGVTIPEAAVVRYEGKGWVYVAADDSTFVRREVALDHPSAAGDGWFTNSGFTGDEKVVTSGAQLLLSQEVFASIGGGGGGGD